MAHEIRARLQTVIYLGAVLTAPTALRAVPENGFEISPVVVQADLVPERAGGPAPTIRSSGVTQRDGVVGQQFTLVGEPKGGTWNVGGTAFQEYSGAATGPVAVNFSDNPVSFYWIDGGIKTVTYTVNGATATVTFSVRAATGSIRAAQVEPVQMLSGFLTAPIRFAANVGLPSGISGTNIWAQVITNTTAGFDDIGGEPLLQCKLAGNSGFPALDQQYPYPYSPGDAPGIFPPVPPPAGIVRARDTQSFSMYLLWQPKGVGTSFPVPLAVIDWNWTGTAEWANRSWSVVAEHSSIAITSTGPTVSYPTWNSIAPSGDFSCSYVGDGKLRTSR